MVKLYYNITIKTRLVMSYSMISHEMSFNIKTIWNKCAQCN